MNTFSGPGPEVWRRSEKVAAETFHQRKVKISQVNLCGSAAGCPSPALSGSWWIWPKRYFRFPPQIETVWASTVRNPVKPLFSERQGQRGRSHGPGKFPHRLSSPGAMSIRSSITRVLEEDLGPFYRSGGSLDHGQIVPSGHDPSAW